MQMRRGGLTVSRIGGIPIILGYTWILLAALIVVIYAPVVDQLVPDLPTVMLFVVSALFALTLLLSVLLHEMGHAVAARYLGIKVRSITLDGLGGFTETEREAPTPATATLVALAGPAVSAALGVVGVIGLAVLPGQTIGWTVALHIAIANLLVTLYNLLPGLPLDGGRAFHALLWKISNNKDSSYVIAGYTGRAIALATVGIGMYLYAAEWLSWIGLIVLAIVGLDLWFGATNAIKGGRMGVKLRHLSARRLAGTFSTIDAATSLQEALDQFPAETWMLVLTDTRPTGILNRDAVAAVPASRREVLIAETMQRSLEHYPRLDIDLEGRELITAMRQSESTMYLVIDGHALVGYLRADDVVSLLT